MLAAVGLDAHSVQKLGAGEPLHPLLPAFKTGLTVAANGWRGASKVLLPASVRLNPLVSTEAAIKEMYADAKATCQSVVNELMDAARVPGAPDSLLKAMLSQPSPANGKLITLDDAYGHIINMMVAGHETSEYWRRGAERRKRKKKKACPSVRAQAGRPPLFRPALS
jgi:hypothetical protein